MSGDLKKIGLIGIGQMAIDYAKVLQALGIPFVAIGKSEAKAAKFKEVVEIDPVIGGIENFLLTDKSIDTFIIAVDVLHLYEVATTILAHGGKRLLIEKPGALYLDQLKALNSEANKKGAEIYIAYNRRYYASVMAAEEIIKEDGGISSVHFEFTEWSHVIEKLEKPVEVKNNWLIANSSHVIDLAFYFSGFPENFSHYKKDSLDWHPAGKVFVGSGITSEKIPFTYHSDWGAPGRWSVEVMTSQSRLFFKPMELLHIQKKGSVEISKVEIDDSVDKNFKPGLYNQTKAFFSGEDKNKLCDLNAHVHLTEAFYSKIIA